MAGLCGGFRCGCGITTDGTIDISGSGEPSDPFVLGVADMTFGRSAAQSSFVAARTITGSFATLPLEPTGQINGPGGTFTFDNADGTIQVTNAGLYLAMFEFSFNVVTPNSASYVHAYLYRNATALAEAITPAGGPYGSVSSQTLLNMAASDTVEVAVATTNVSGVATRDGSLTLIRVPYS